MAQEQKEDREALCRYLRYTRFPSTATDNDKYEAFLRSRAVAADKNAKILSELYCQTQLSTSILSPYENKKAKAAARQARFRARRKRRLQEAQCPEAEASQPMFTGGERGEGINMGSAEEEPAETKSELTNNSPDLQPFRDVPDQCEFKGLVKIDPGWEAGQGIRTENTSTDEEPVPYAPSRSEFALEGPGGNLELEGDFKKEVKIEPGWEGGQGINMDSTSTAGEPLPYYAPSQSECTSEGPSYIKREVEVEAGWEGDQGIGMTSNDGAPVMYAPGGSKLTTEGFSDNKCLVKIEDSDISYPCPQCEFQTPEAEEFNEHMQSHTEEKPYVCNECGFRTALACKLKQHKRTHSGEKPYACNECEFRTARANSLKQHMTTHSGEKPYVCNECEFRTGRADKLKRHMRIHSGVKPYACDECDFRTTRADSLNLHMRNHTGDKPYECNECDFTTARTHHFKQHMRTHSGEKPYSCNECDFKTAQRSSLKPHMRTHLGGKPYACNECDFRTTHTYKLKRHMRTHSGEKPYACIRCDFKTAWTDKLKRHMLTHTH